MHKAICVHKLSEFSYESKSPSPNANKWKVASDMSPYEYK